MRCGNESSRAGKDAMVVVWDWNDRRAGSSEKWCPKLRGAALISCSSARHAAALSVHAHRRGGDGGDGGVQDRHVDIERRALAKETPQMFCGSCSIYEKAIVRSEADADGTPHAWRHAARLTTHDVLGECGEGPTCMRACAALLHCCVR